MFNLQNWLTFTEQVNIGSYRILVRYGANPEDYVYSRGGPFLVTQSETEHSEVTITLTQPAKDDPKAREEYETTPVDKLGKQL
jgi:hypothetical protein